MSRGEVVVRVFKPVQALVSAVLNSATMDYRSWFGG
jgi:hypothetical protein